MPIQTAADSISNSAGSPYGFKNRIINGNMNIDQRYAGSSVSPGSGKLYVVDRWAVQSASASKFTVGQNLNSVGAPNGFTNYFGVSVATTYTPSASDYNYLAQNIEGLNTLDLMWGTSQAKTVSVSFWAYSNLAGLHSGFICGRDFNNAWPYTFTLVANTWTYVTLTIPGPTTGDGSTWFKDNQQGIWVGFNLGMGSNWTGATAGAWNGALLQSTGAVSLVQNAGATLFITGVQFEKGPQATAFDWRPYTIELQLCQRYCQTTYDIGTATGTATQTGLINTNAIQFAGGVGGSYGSINFTIPMRAAASISFWDGAGTLNSKFSYTYGGGASAQSILNAGDVWGAAAPFNISSKSFFMRPVSTQANAMAYIHYLATSEL
jgi:hypothetical protein